MKKLKYIAFIIVSAVLFACNDDDKLDPNKDYVGLGGETWEWTDLDQWLYDTFTVPYNMNIKYKWDQYEVDLNKMMTPIKESNVRPVMYAFQKIWAEPYLTVGGETFVKSYCPKKYVLVGSPRYDSGGIYTLGEAEGGVKVTLYRLNWFSESDREIVTEVMRTVHHEFGHVLHQTIKYPDEFETITPGGYTSNWSLSTETEAMAQELGFISRYARSSPDEDFVELIARIAIYGQDAFEAWVAGSTEEGSAALRRKEEIMVNYFRDVWNINFYDGEDGQPGLVTLVQNAIDEVTGGSVSDVRGNIAQGDALFCSRCSIVHE